MRIYNIDWDAEDDIKSELPTEMDIPEQEAIYLYGIADYLSDQIGFCVNSFSF